jgi:DNA ligase (NAD+)
MNIDGISEQTIARFVNLGWINEYADIYRLTEHIQEISALEGFGRKSALNIREAINKATTVDARKLLYALNIPLVGQDVCKRLLTAHKLDEIVQLATQKPDFSPVEGDLFASNDTVGEYIFASIDGIGPEKSASVVRWFNDENNLRTYNNLVKLINIIQEDNTPIGAKCEGLTFVVTGDVNHYKNRNELKKYIESQGGKVTGSVSKSTSYLINNDVTSTSGKNQKAMQLGTPIISEEQFIEMFGQ